jgi:hypothetical protein
MKNIRENTLKKPLRFLAKTQRFCKLHVSDKQNRSHGFTYLFFSHYIRAAGGHSIMESVFVAIHCLRLFFCPYLNFSFKNSEI